MLSLQFRNAVPADSPECIVLRGKTRENAVSAERLASLGITAESWGSDIRTGKRPGHVCTSGGQLVGYCFGDRPSGEVIVLAVLPEFEGKGIGTELLSKVVRDLRSAGHDRLFLGCSPNPKSRSFGFYRHLGWRTTNSFDAHGDEILELVNETRA